MELNKSGLRPLGQAVLIRPYEPEVKQGRIQLPDGVAARMQTIEQRAVVLEVGPEAWKTERQPRAHPGDHVFVSKHAGWEFVGLLDGKPYRMVNGNDIFAQITSEGERNG